MRLGVTLFLALMLGGATSLYAAKLYKWVDPAGKVTYQDRPPPGDVIDYDERNLNTSLVQAGDGDTTALEITLYGIKECEPCAQTRDYLTEKTLAFSERDPESDPRVAAEMIERFGAPEVPIVVINGEVVRGHNPLWIDSLVAKATPPPEESNP